MTINLSKAWFHPLSLLFWMFAGRTPTCPPKPAGRSRKVRPCNKCHNFYIWSRTHYGLLQTADCFYIDPFNPDLMIILGFLMESPKIHRRNVMPIYEYICLECGHEFEKLVRNSTESNDIQCPECKSSQLEDKVSGFASVSAAGGLGSSNCTPGGGWSINWFRS